MAGKREARQQEPSRILYEVEGVLCLAVGAVLALSFASYVPDSPAINHVGPLGYWLANLLVQSFGYASYLFPLMLAAGAIALFSRRLSTGSPVQIVGALAMLLESAVLLGLYRPDVKAALAGGWVGGFIATVMRDAMGLVGSTVVLGALGLLTWLMITGTPLSDLVVGLINLLRSGVESAVEVVTAGLRGIGGFISDHRPRFANSEDDDEEFADQASPRKSRGRSVEDADDAEFDLGLGDEPSVVFGDAEISAGEAEVEVEPKHAEPIIEISRPKPRKPEPEEKEESEEFHFELDDTDYRLPPTKLLGKSDDSGDRTDDKALVAQSKILEQKLATFGVSGRVTAVRPGPVITTFEFEPDAGIKVSRVVNLSDDLTMAMRAHGVRIVAPIPGKNVVGIEVSNRQRSTVGIRDLIEGEEFGSRPSPLTLAIGRDTTGLPAYADLGKMPHLLMAGATGTGKSVSLNALIISLLYKATPRDVRFIMIDPKMLEMSLYEGIPHLLVPVVTDVKKASAALANVIREMDRRFELMKDLQVRSIDDYNARIAEDFVDEEEEYEEAELEEYEEEEYEAESAEYEEEEGEDEEGGDEYEEGEDEEGEEEYEEDEYEEGEEEYEEDEEEYEAEGAEDEEEEYEEAEEEEGLRHEHLPRIVVVVDELADLMMTVGRDVETSITRLAQKARAAGIHLILATQRPSVDVITGLIKANFPSRISFKVTSRPDSRTILDTVGADRLLGNGDMLYMAPGTSFLQRLHGAFISDKEIRHIVDFLKKQGDPEYWMDLLEDKSAEAAGDDDEEYFDELYDKAVDLVLENGQGSTSWLQRKLGVGYNRAARMMEHMEREGVVGPSDGAKPRKVIVGNAGNGV